MNTPKTRINNEELLLLLLLLLVKMCVLKLQEKDDGKMGKDPKLRSAAELEAE